MLVNTKARIGVFSIALGAYLPQFPTLVPEFKSQYRAFKNSIPDTVEKVGSWTFRNTGLSASSSGAVYADNWLVDCKPDIGGTLDVAEGTVGIAVYALQNA